MDVAEHIAVDPAVMMGKPTVRGTRVTVELILRKLSDGATEVDLVRAHPGVSREGVRAAVAYAAETIAQTDRRGGHLTASTSSAVTALIALGVLFGVSAVLLISWLLDRMEKRSALPLIHRAASEETSIGGLTANQWVILLNTNRQGLVFNVWDSKVVLYADGPAFFVRGDIHELSVRRFGEYYQVHHTHYLLVRGPDRVAALRTRPEEVAQMAESEDVAAFRVVNLRRLAWSIAREGAAAA